MLWHGLRRVMINLIEIPFRFRLAEEVFEARKNGYLSVEYINKLTRKCWSDCYGDTVEGVDQYMWARKPHFYNVYNADSPHHDFQYTVGFLSANMMLKKLEEVEKRKFLVSVNRCFWIMPPCRTRRFSRRISKRTSNLKNFGRTPLKKPSILLRKIRPYVGELNRPQR